VGGDLPERLALLGEDARDRRVHVAAHRLREAAVDGGADDRVREAQRRARGDDARVDEVRRCGGGRRLVDVGERRGVAQLTAGAHDRDGLGQARRRLRQRGDPADDVAPDAGGPRGRDVRAAADLRRELGDEERVAAGGVVAGAAEVVVRLAEPVAHERRDGVGAERLEQAAVRLRARRDAVEQVARRSVARGPGGQHDEDPDVPRPRPEVGQPLQGRHVRPVCVVHEERQRPLHRDVRGEPEEAVQASWGGRTLERLGQVGRLPAPEPEHRPRERGGAGEQLLALGLVGEQHAPLEELADDPERVRGLQLAPAGGQAGDALLARAAARPLEQRGLADPGRSLEGQHTTLPVHERVEGRACEVELRLAVVQLLQRWSPRGEHMPGVEPRARREGAFSTVSVRNLHGG
jgi:hypothetical protein